jgi:hypothetical protein
MIVDRVVLEELKINLKNQPANLRLKTNTFTLKGKIA